MQTSTNQSTAAKAAATKIALLVFLVALVAGVVALVYFLATTPKASLAQKTRAARTSKLTQTDQSFNQKQQLPNSLGVTTGTLASSKQDVCYVYHLNVGFSVSGVYQDCFVRYVAGYTTKLSQKDAMAVIRKSTASEINFGQPSDFGCQLYKDQEETKLTWRPAGMPVAGNMYRSSCEIPDPVDPVTTTRLGMADSKPAIHSYETYSPNTIDIGSNQIWLTYTVTYSHEKIHCGWNIACSLTTGKPVSGY